MRRSLLGSVVLVCLICFGSLGGVIAAGWSPKLGLDLEGGLSVVFQPAHKATAAQLQTVVAIMQHRANGLGLANDNIGTQGNDVVVQLPGVKDFSTVIKEIGSTLTALLPPGAVCGERLRATDLVHDHDHHHDFAEVQVLHHDDDGEVHLDDDDHDDGAEGQEEGQGRRVRGAAAVQPGFSLHGRDLRPGQLERHRWLQPRPRAGYGPQHRSRAHRRARTPRRARFSSPPTRPRPAASPAIELGPTPYDGKTPATGEILSGASSSVRSLERSGLGS